MRIYLDNCCYNRPYDDQSQIRISLETQAKLEIQKMIKEGELELISSYVLRYENSRNPFELRRKFIEGFVRENTSVYIDVDRADQIKQLADDIIATGVKTADAYHVACAILAEGEFFLSTDDRLLKYQTDSIKIVDPITFIRNWEVE